MNNMREIWDECRQYGRVLLATGSGGYWSQIEFMTIKGAELKAKHEGYRDTPEGSLLASLEAAKQIVASIQSNFPQPEKKLLEG